MPNALSPKVSVLMLTYNRPQFLDRAIQSVLDQGFEDWELIVVHDGPNQQTAATVQEWVERDPRVRYFHRQLGGNIANACNYGLSFARGEYVAILDDDDYWIAKGKLSKQVAFLDENPGYAGCGAGMTVIDDRGNELMSYLKPELDEDIKRRALWANPMTHSTTMFRRSVCRDIGFYDESLAGYQDWDLWLRLGQAGKLYNFQELFARYTMWSGGGSFHQQRRNALSALKIVLRHRNEYNGFTGAFGFVILHFAYAHLPSFVRRRSFAFLSQLKKLVFSGDFGRPGEKALQSPPKPRLARFFSKGKTVETQQAVIFRRRSEFVEPLIYNPMPSFSVVYFGNDWCAENRTSSHHIAIDLSRSFPVLYVDTPGMRPPSRSRRDLLKIVRIARKFLASPRQVGPQMWHITAPQIPYRNFPLVERLNRTLGRWLIRRAARHLGFRDRLSWFAVPHPAEMAGHVGDDFVVYYCIDDYASMAQMDAKRIQRLDDTLSRRADVVFVSSQSLQDRKRELNSRVEYSPHGVDFDLFRQAQDSATCIAEAARDLPHPIIGYFGSIAHHTDLELIAYLARERPLWTFLLIGMASANTRELKSLPNVHLPGGQPYETLPRWAKAFDVTLIPYRPWFAQHSSSLKVREYLACGKPVVTVSTPEIENYRSVVSIASTHEEFLTAIELALKTDSAEARRARQDVVRDSSWEACAARSRTYVEKLYAEKKQGARSYINTQSTTRSFRPEQ